MAVLELNLVTFLVLSLCGLLIGLTKTGLQGGTMIAVGVAATYFGARPSTGILLPVLMVADLFGLRFYHHYVKWVHVLMLLPGTVVGILIAVYVGETVQPEAFAPLLAAVLGFGLLILILAPLRAARLPKPGANLPETAPQKRPKLWGFAAGTGIVSGFSSMIGNAAGAVLSVYLLALRLPKNVFIGVTAWYFFLNNAVKLPFHIFVWGTVAQQSLILSAAALPAVVIGALGGVAIVRRVPEQAYRVFVIAVTGAAVLRLVL